MFGTVTLGVLLPFIGTTLGAATVFLFKEQMPSRLKTFLLAFASGIMLAAAVWSLILPAEELSLHLGEFQWLPPVVGFAFGMLFLLALDVFAPDQLVFKKKPSALRSVLGDSGLLFFSVTLHNIPEGMAVGAVFAGLLAMETRISIAMALSLSFGMSIQNFPEGAIISLPLRANGNSRGKAFAFGSFSGIVEPISALITIACSKWILPILPYFLSFAAGAMVYVVAQELIPESCQKSHKVISVLGLTLGFSLMMVLDMAFG